MGNYVIKEECFSTHKSRKTYNSSYHTRELFYDSKKRAEKYICLLADVAEADHKDHGYISVRLLDEMHEKVLIFRDISSIGSSLCEVRLTLVER